MTRPTTASAPLLRLLRAARRRLWWDTIVRRMPLAVWLAGLTLLAVGGLALLSAFKPDWTVTGSLVCGAIVAALAPGIAARPSLTDAALHADRTFGTRALLVSALEADAAADPSPAAGEVMRRAREAADELLAERRRLRQTPQISRAALALIPAFLGLLLLRLASPADEASTAREAVRATGTTSLTARDEDERSLQRLRQTLTANSSEQPEAYRSEERVRIEAPSAAPPDPQATREEAAGIEPRSPGYAAASNEGGAEAGDAQAGAPGGTEAMDAMDAGESGMTPADAATLIRQGNTVATAAATGTGYAEGASRTARGSPVRPAAAPPQGAAHTRLSPAQTAYARRYLESTGDGS